jgi:hypothetical protein
MEASSWATVIPSGSRLVTVPGIYSSTEKKANCTASLSLQSHLIAVSVKLDLRLAGCVADAAHLLAS